ncbi:MAG TPA: MaoC/PaaZ C-terminal domain-containing protein [Candidatus Limnocylindrales bacterium]|nr:MaoC/PaaZ C-terminal domain-containing protein [Candidatus Limnocylindrales bacterium]
MSQAAEGDRRYLEDFEVGQRIVAPDEYEVTNERAVAFAEEFDPQPIHTDSQAAADELFGGLVASGWHTLGATTRLIMLARPLGSTPVVGVGIDNLRFIAPVRAGDLLSAEAEVLSVKPSSSRPDRGYLVLRVTTRREADDALVLTQDWTLILPRRGARLDLST